MATVLEPAQAAANAMLHMSANNFHCSVTLRAYCAAAIDVPKNEGILVVPSKVATGYCGSVIKVAGVCISPPPPTMASIKPAANAAMQRINICWVITCYNFFRQIISCRCVSYCCLLPRQCYNRRSCPYSKRAGFQRVSDRLKPCRKTYFHLMQIIFSA